MKRSSKMWLAGAVLVMLAMTAPVSAQDLRLAVDGTAGVLVENQSSQPMTEVGFFPGLGWSLNCSGGSGNGVATLTSLRVKEPRRCSGDASAAAKRSAVVASARLADGRISQAHASRILMLNPGEGIALVAAGAVHNDSDSDGRLDTGETISYHYTVLNLGDLALTSLALVDQTGAVTCPQTALAVGASMVCTRNYTISAGDQTAGLIINQVDIDGLDSATRPVGATDVVVSQNLAGRAGVRVFKSPRIADDADNNNVTSVGDRIEYTFVVKNSGAESLANVNLFEPDTSRIDTPITCSPTTLGGAAFAGIGTGSLTSNDVLLCTAQYTVRASDATIRQVLNVAEVRAQAPVAGTVIATASSTVVVPVPPMIGVSKALISNEGIGPGPYAVRYNIVVENFGTVALQTVQVTDNLRQTFPLPVTFSVISVAVNGTGTPNPNFNGITDINLLNAAQSTLAPGASFIIDLRISVAPGDMRGPFLNSVIAVGSDSINQSVADVSVVGMNPDPDSDGDPDEDDPTPVSFNVIPPLVNIPATSPAVLLLMCLLVGVVAVRSRMRG
ncbi:MAG: DUF7507 domain-containing protein [Pseudomarimonas sp.]